MKFGKWTTVKLCRACGVVVDRHQVYDKQCCERCGVVGQHLLPYYLTSYRTVTTYSPTILERLKGERSISHVEWSGKDQDNQDISNLSVMLNHNRIISMTTTTIAAAGIASGLF